MHDLLPYFDFTGLIGPLLSIERLPAGGFLVIAVLSALGASFLSRLTGFDTLFNLVVNFLAMALFARIAFNMLDTVHLPLGNELVVMALYCNVGMMAAGLLLGYWYVRADRAGR